MFPRIVAVSFICIIGFGQIPTTIDQSNQNQETIQQLDQINPLTIRMFFDQIVAIDDLANKEKTANASGILGWKNLYRDKFNLTNQEAALLIETAKRNEADMDNFDRKGKSIVEAIRLGSMAGSRIVPRPELVQLGKERNNTLLANMEILKSCMSETSFNTVLNFIMKFKTKSVSLSGNNQNPQQESTSPIRKPAHHTQEN